MGKGSGSTRSSSSGSPRGLTATEQNIVNVNNAVFSQNNAISTGMTENQRAKAEKEVDRTGFKNTMNGQWDLETPYGGAMILDETDFRGEMFGYKEYGVSAWDANFDMIEDGQEGNAKRFESLNEAKRYAKELIKGKLK